MRKNLFIITVFMSCFGTGVGFYNDSDINQAQAALEKFYTCPCMSDKMTQPLYEGGPKVITLVIQNIRNKNMPRRLHAMAFLGSKGNSRAVTALEEIINDSSEDNYVRKFALDSIFRIDSEKAKRIAIQYKDGNDFLGCYSKCILTNNRCI